MATEKILIFGRGYISSVISNREEEAKNTVVVYGSDRLNLTDCGAIRAVVEHEKPTRIINTTAYTATAAAELPENRAEAFRLNVQVPCTILEALTPYEIPWLHFSTGMMFDGTRPDGKGWSESDIPEPKNYYSLTKAFADNAILPFAEKSRLIIARIHVPLASFEHPRNFLNRLLKFEKAINIPSSMAVLDDIIPAIDTLFTAEKYGLYNCVNPGEISTFEILKKMEARGLLPKDRSLSELSRAELDAMGGAYQTFPILSTEELEKAGCILPSISDSIDTLLNQYVPAT